MASLTPAGAATNLAHPMTTPNSPAAILPAAPEGEARGGARVTVRGLVKAFEHGGRTIEVLRGLDFELAPGEIASVVGASGVGKSTLLQVLGTLDAPSAGSIAFDGIDVTTLGATRLAEFRNREIGFVFQFHHLLPEFTALENAMMPGLIRGCRAVWWRSAPPPCWRGLASGIACRTGRASCRAASSSGWRWRAPSSYARGCCWRMSRPGTWTPRPGVRCTTSSSSSIASWGRRC